MPDQDGRKNIARGAIIRAVGQACRARLHAIREKQRSLFHDAMKEKDERKMKEIRNKIRHSP